MNPDFRWNASSNETPNRLSLYSAATALLIAPNAPKTRAAGFGSAPNESKGFARAGRYSASPRSDCYKFKAEKLRWCSDLGISLPQSAYR